MASGSDEVLSQDEIDSLFGEEAGDASAAPPIDANRVRKYDLANQERIVRGRMPTLEIINERFARNFRLGLFNFMRRTPEISIGPVRVLKYSAFLRELALPANLNIVQLKPLRGSSLFIFEPSLVFAVVESLFGGNGKVQTRIEGRDFTLTEQRIVQRLLELVMSEYAKAWKPVYRLTAEYVRSEMQPQFINIATPSEVVVATKLDIDLGAGGGAIHLVVPYASLEPIRDILLSSTQTDTGQADSRWLGMLSHQVQSAEVELIATLATVNATLKQVLNMRPGDVISINLPERIVAGVDGVPLFECKSGVANGRYAMRVERVLNASRDFKLAGDQHAE